MPLVSGAVLYALIVIGTVFPEYRDGFKNLCFFNSFNKRRTDLRPLANKSLAKEEFFLFRRRRHASLLLLLVIHEFDIAKFVPLVEPVVLRNGDRIVPKHRVETLTIINWEGDLVERIQSELALELQFTFLFALIANHTRVLDELWHFHLVPARLGVLTAPICRQHNT